MGDISEGRGPIASRDQRFAELYEAHFEAIYAYVLRRVERVEVADVLQDVFSVAWRSARRVPAPPQDRLWLYGVARRVVGRSRWDVARRWRLQERLAGDPALVAGRAEVPDLVQSRLHDAIALLRPRDREIVRLIIWDELSRAEVAQLLGCSVNAVDIRFHRARKRLRARLLPTEAVAPPRDTSLPVAK